MCGIAGVHHAGGRRADVGRLLTMLGQLAHRGPDGSGVYVEDELAMGNTRLAIVDVAHGDQPLSDDSGRYFVVQNGEIYNHVELRERLASLGHRFATHCDTEVIAHAFAAWGLRALREFNGAFAIALWDRQERRLWLARDRLGKRPLFVAQLGGALLFGSEAKALLCHPELTRQLDPVALVEQAVLWSSLGRSAFQGIRELPPGTLLERRADGTTREQPWWQLQMEASPDNEGRSDAELSEHTLALLDDSVRLRLRADVPVAAYLSGGLDSSAIAALAQRHVGGNLRAFGVRFTDRLFDERAEQDAVARALSVPLDTLEVSATDIAQALPEVVEHAERPMHRTAPAPLLLLSRQVRRAGFKVVLTGEGADELFAGYQIFQEQKIRRFWARHPDSRLRPRLLGRVHPYLARDLSRSGAFLDTFFGRNLTATDDPLYSHRLRFDNCGRLLRLLAPELVRAAELEGSPAERLTAALPEAFGHFGALGRAQYLEIATFFGSYLLHTQADRVLMASSVEGRFPFLDHRLVEFAGALPERAKLRGLKDKYILRRAVAPLLPAAIRRRPKQPYRAPILEVIAGPGAPPELQHLLSERALRDSRLFDTTMVTRLLAKCRRNLTSGLGVGEVEEMGLVFVLTTQLLEQRLVQHLSPAHPAEPSRIVLAGRVATRAELER